MAKKKAATRNLITDYKTERTKKRLNQHQFWTPIGVTQSCGSRYESGRPVPTPTQTVIDLTYGTAKAALEKLAALRGVTVEALMESVSK